MALIYLLTRMTKLEVIKTLKKMKEVMKKSLKIPLAEMVKN